MNKEKTDTKSSILQVSLDLFATRGYNAISIRDISGKVGIKESSVYNHFKNKQSIFDELCSNFMNVTYAMPQSFAVEMAKVTSVKEEEFLLVCQSFLNDYLMDDKINKFIRMLIIEQSTNLQAAALYHKVLFDDALISQKAIFEWLIRIGFLQNCDVEDMVMEYYAPIIFLFHRYLIVEKITEGTKAEVNRKLLQHVKGFLRKYKTTNQRLED